MNFSDAPITVEAWIYPTRADLVNEIIQKAGGGNSIDYPGYQLRLDNGRLSFDVGGVSSVSGAVGPQVPLNQWSHVAGICQGSDIHVYLNGQLVGSTTASTVLAPASGSLRIGCRNDGWYFKGMIDEISIYNRALSSDEIAAIYAASSAGKCKSGQIPGASVPYFTDFENGIGPEWTTATTDNSEPAFTRFAGRFGNTTQTLILTNVVPGQAYTIGFDFYAIDEWNGDASGQYFNVAVDGLQVFHETFANYNGNPPNSTQTFSRQPDEGRANCGFNPSYVDSIYRNIEIAFTASISVTAISFGAQNLWDLGSISSGVDNVSVRPSSDLTNTFVRSATLPPDGSTNSVAFGSFTISANQPLLASSASAGASYVLSEAGSDGILGTGDDVIYSLTPSIPGGGGRSVALGLLHPPLQPGHYRFQTTANLQDANSNPLPTFTRDFFIANPVAGVIQAPSYNGIPSDTPLSLTESPVGSGFYTALGVGVFSSTSEVDYWLFEGEAGDTVSVRVEATSLGVYPQLYLQNGTGGTLASTGGDYYGVAMLQSFVFSAPGTYYLRVWTGNNPSRYRLRLDLSRGPQLENESNDSPANANWLNLSGNTGLAQGRIAGALPVSDSSGDFFSLGVLSVGDIITANALFPTGSVLTATQLLLSVQANGNATALVTNSTDNLSCSAPSNGVYYLHVESTNRDLRAQYLLTVALNDGVLPSVTDASLPADGSTNNGVLDRFSVSFSKDMNAGTVNDVGNWDLRAGGVDGVFGTGDDVVYHLSSYGYSSGLSASYRIVDGPLQPGPYRLVGKTNLTDRAGNGLAANFVRNFTVVGVANFVLEGRHNDTAATATSLSLTPGSAPDGSFTVGGSTGVGSYPYFVAAGLFNGDTNLDLVVANGSGNSVSVLLGNGDGTFGPVVNYSVGSYPYSVAVGDVNGDGKMDLVVANYSGNSVSVLLGNGDGTFGPAVNYGVGSNPYSVAVGDFNWDGRLDVVTANISGNSVSVLLGNGDGTFGPAAIFGVGSNPYWVAVGDVNGDGRLDVVTANYSVYSDNYFWGLATIINSRKSHLSFLTQPQLKLS